MARSTRRPVGRRNVRLGGWLALSIAVGLAACTSKDSGGGGGSPSFDSGSDVTFDVSVEAANDAPAETTADAGHDSSNPIDAPSEASGWSPVGGGEIDPGNASFGRIAALNGKIYAAFSDSSVGGALTVLGYTGGTSWNPVGTAGFNGNGVDATNMALALDSSGAPWVAYIQTDTDSGLGYVYVSAFSGGTWALKGAGAASTITGNVSLAVMGGAPYIAFDDSGNVPHVMTTSGGVWTDVGTAVDDAGLSDGGVPTTAYYLTLGTDGTTLYLAYNDGNANTVLQKLTGSSWATLGTSTSSIDEAWAPNVTVSSGKVFVSYWDATNGAVVLEQGGTGLQSVGTLGSISNGDSIEAVSGTVYNAVPYVAFDDENRDGDETPEAATVKDWTGSQWALYAGYPNPCDIEDTFITADPSNGKLYLTYSDCSGSMFVQVH